ncbi:hypothetical protein SAMN05444172_8433 [Burkholderia sp. GAS332]|nr:hypothetical protein SAMN05444172_8433 [Burkholderia sp. GAS332]
MKRSSYGQAEEAATRYRQEIQQAFKGEVLGQRLFFELSRHYRKDSYARRAFQLLTEVERETGALLRELLVRHGIECLAPTASTANESAVEQGLKLRTWDMLMLEMSRRISPAVVRFEALLRDAPAADQECIELLVAHERVLEAFVQWRPLRSNDALRPALRYLRQVRYYNQGLKF